MICFLLWQFSSIWTVESSLDVFCSDLDGGKENILIVYFGIKGQNIKGVYDITDDPGEALNKTFASSANKDIKHCLRLSFLSIGIN